MRSEPVRRMRSEPVLARATRAGTSGAGAGGGAASAGGPAASAQCLLEIADGRPFTVGGQAERKTGGGGAEGRQALDKRRGGRGGAGRGGVWGLSGAGQAERGRVCGVRGAALRRVHQPRRLLPRRARGGPQAMHTHTHTHTHTHIFLWSSSRRLASHARARTLSRTHWRSRPPFSLALCVLEAHAPSRAPPSTTHRKGTRPRAPLSLSLLRPPPPTTTTTPRPPSTRCPLKQRTLISISTP